MNTKKLKPKRAKAQKAAKVIGVYCSECMGIIIHCYPPQRHGLNLATKSWVVGKHTDLQDCINALKVEIMFLQSKLDNINDSVYHGSDYVYYGDMY